MHKHDMKATKEHEVKFIKKVEPAQASPTTTTQAAAKGKAIITEGKRIGTGCIPVSGD